MGIIYNKNAQEQELYIAYGFTVYGKINKYEWTIYPDRALEDVLISLRITDENGNDIYNKHLGNNCSFMKIFNNTIDNFLYWIKNDKPDAYSLNKAVFDCLCSNNSLFNHRMENRKFKEFKE
ncbi:hypothetical protein H8S37_04405 [Mediterraneibacter sp. NSJ-55]|uniref:Uncharacterized protein n=1 Tax=Mediterraneibacter hominis TaxID=2763054 RepID=A0A923LH45_9FIRM|nr:hypothetical protein [Mediterraneibacter hominis]MBC5688175.1 hypothetical protein [Mediterraneibacter hominis]